MPITRFRQLALGVLLVLGLSSPTLAADHGPGYGGAIQSGTCSALTEDTLLKVSSGNDDFAFLPYTVDADTTPDANVYFGTRTVPGFSPLTLLGGDSYALVVHGSDGATVACGNILMPKQRSYIDQGVLLVQISPLPNSTVSINGVAILRAPATSDTDKLTIAEVILLETTGEPIAPKVEATPDV